MISLKTRRDPLLAALKVVGGIVQRRPALPILANVLIRQRGGQIEFTTSDLDMQIRTRIGVEAGAGDFATTVHARKLTDILRSLPAELPLTLALRAKTLTLQVGRSRFTLQTRPADEFPLTAEAADLGPALSVPQAALKDLIDQVAFAMAAQDIRYFLNGALLVTEGRLLRLVATDGNRLALAEAELDVELPKHQLILPRNAVHELQRQLRDPDAEADGCVEMRFSATQARFGLNGIEFITRLVEGRFPDYARVIPGAHPHTAALARTPWLESLQRASLLSHARFRGIRLGFHPGTLRIASSNNEQEQAEDEMPIAYEGERIEMGLNVDYLLDVLGSTDAEQVRLAMLDANSSVMLTFPERAGFRYVVSPMRL